MLRTLIAAALILAGAGMSASAADAATVNACGTLQALTRPNPPQQEGPGAATIDGKAYRLSSALSSNGTNTIGTGVAVGKRVCLSGEVVEGTTDFLNNYVLVACDQPNAPSGCGSASTATAISPPTLPSTTTVTNADGGKAKSGSPVAAFDPWLLTPLVLGGTAFALFLAQRSRKASRRRRSALQAPGAPGGRRR